MRRNRLVLGSLLISATVGVFGCDDDSVSPRPVGVSIDPSTAAIAVGDTLQLVATVATERNTRGSSITWASDDTTVARVDADGRVVGVSGGTAKISAIAGDAEGTATVEVWQPVQIDDARIGDVTHPLARRLVADLDGEAALEVDYWTNDGPRLRVVSESPDTSATLLLARLRGDRSYTFEAQTVGPGDLRGPAFSGTFDTDPLPAEFDAVGFSATGESSHLTLVSLRSYFSGFVVVDSDGEVVWHHATEGTPQGSSQRANYQFALVDLTYGTKVISPDGELVAHDMLRSHHDVIPTPEGSLLFFTRSDRRTEQDTTWVGDTVWEWFPETGERFRRWDMFDFYSILEDRMPRSRPDDWGHANAIAIGPRGNYVMSFAFLNQVISMSSDWRTVEWRVGGPNPTHVPEPAARFSGQHTAAEVSAGRVLLFDNGYDRSPDAEYSRALELSLNGGVAEVAWEFRPAADNYARIISAARRLANGNTLVHFGTSVPIGTATDGGPIETFEVTPEGEVAWHLTVAKAQSIYRATPIRTIAGEVEVPVP